MRFLFLIMSYSMDTTSDLTNGEVEIERKKSLKMLPFPTKSTRQRMFQLALAFNDIEVFIPFAQVHGTLMRIFPGIMDVSSSLKTTNGLREMFGGEWRPTDTGLRFDRNNCE